MTMKCSAAIEAIDQAEAMANDAPEQLEPSFLADAQKANPEYFSDLPPLPAGSR